MRKLGFLIPKYIFGAILPYFIIAWLLLSVILFFQQAVRYSDFFFNTFIPQNLVWQITFALIPNVIAFTGPMAVLIGIVIGLSKLQDESELIAVRNSGFGTIQFLIPVLILGAAVSAFSFFVNIFGVPYAAGVMRKVALQTAVKKFESPVEPQVFNTELNDWTVFVKEGDVENGIWKNIFLYQKDKVKNQMRLITAEEGHLGIAADKTELNLSDVNSITLTSETFQNPVIDKLDNLHVSINTKRDEAISKLSQYQKTPEELGLSELATYAETKQGSEQVEARILFQRRIVLSVTPILFAILGGIMVLRFGKLKRNFNIFLALASLLSWYLIMLIGEQLARTNYIGVFTAGILPNLFCVILIIWFWFFSRAVSDRINSSGNIFINQIKEYFTSKKIPRKKIFSYNIRIQDTNIIAGLARYFLLTTIFLTAIYLLFTAFELWKFTATISDGTILLFRYLFYLIPFVYLQLVSGAVLVSILAVFVVKSRHNELITWIAAGRSVHRLLLPCYIAFILLGIFNFILEDKVATETNRIQDNLRGRIKSGGTFKDTSAETWLARDNRIYNYKIDKNNPDKKIYDLQIFEIMPDKNVIGEYYFAKDAVWNKDQIELGNDYKYFNTINPRAIPSKPLIFKIENFSPQTNQFQKPSQLSIRELEKKIDVSGNDDEQRVLQIYLQKKFTALFLPLVVALFTVIFAVSIHSRNRIYLVGYAVGIWLVFVGTSNFLEQLGMAGSIPPWIAVWSPMLLFGGLGLFLTTRIKT